jgi:hypothetical protein
VQNEVSTLLTDIKEQILYLQELGVESFDAELPEIFQSPKSKVQSPKFEEQSSKFKIQSSESAYLPEKSEKYVPDIEILKSVAETAPPKVESEEIKTARRSLLDQTRLSRMPSLPKRKAFIPKNQNQERGEKEEMPGKKIEETPQDTLFGDITQTLPDTNETLEDIHLDCGNCTRCPLWEGRTKIVHSEGNRQADLMFVGEAPGANEDAEGRPFVGRDWAGARRRFYWQRQPLPPAGKPHTDASRSRRLQAVFNPRNRCRAPENHRRSGKYRDAESAQHENRNHKAARRISGLLRRQSDADISSGVSSARPVEKARNVGRYEKSARRIE